MSNHRHYGERQLAEDILDEAEDASSRAAEARQRAREEEDALGLHRVRHSYCVEAQEVPGAAWTRNALRFGTNTQAQDYLHDLSRRWMANGFRVAETDDPVTHFWLSSNLGGRAVPV